MKTRGQVFKILLLSIAVCTLRCSSLAQAPPCATVPSGLVSWWRGESNTLDQVGGNNGTAVGNTGYLPSEVGSGFFFNGSGSAVDVGNPPNLQLQDMTIDAWIKRSNASLVTADPYLSANIFACAWGGYALGIWADGRIFLSKVGYSGAFSTNTITDTNHFHHVVASKSGTSVVLYIDGVAESVGPYDPGFVFNGPSAIGSRGLDYVNSFLGQIDEVSIYNRGLSSEEVLSIYNAGNSGKCVQSLAPYIVTQPASRAVTSGGSTSFTVVAGGTAPLSYQWMFNGTNIGGATTTILSLGNVQSSQAGDYSVLVSNSVNSVLSTNALLTVLPPPTNCVVAPSGLVSWWKGESDTVDQVGGNNGTAVGNTSYLPSEVGQGFFFNGSGSAVDVGNPPNLQLQDMTIEAWIKRSNGSLVTADPYLSANIFACAWGGYALGIWTDGRIFLSKVGYSGAFSTNTITDTNYFHHVVASKSGTNVVLYVDGVAESVGPYDPGFVFNGPSAIGSRGLDYANSFLGQIDEVSIYNRGLSGAEVQAIYTAGSAGKCVSQVAPYIVTQPASRTVTVGGSAAFTVVAGGSLPLSYQWSFNGTNIDGATTTILSLVGVQFDQAGDYAVAVSNSVNAVVSSNALLTVVTAPVCTPVPGGLVSWWKGESNTVDQVGGNNGTAVGNTSYLPSEVGQGFFFNASGSAVDVGNPPNLQLQDMTIEAWIKRSNASLVTADPYLSANIFACAWGGYALGIWTDGRIFLSKVGYSGVFSTNTITDINQFHHVVAAKSGTNVTLYIDGVAESVGPYDPGFVFNGPSAIGARGLDYANSFLGTIDEVSIYNRGLTGAEVQAIYSAGSAGKCASGVAPFIVTQPASRTVTVGGSAAFTVVAGGSLPLSYQWSFNGTNIDGATATLLSLTNVQPSQAGNYAVFVSNSVNSVLSSNALLTVSPPQTNCTPAPSGLVSWWKGENNALDQAGGNNGALSGNVTYGSGEVGQGFLFASFNQAVAVGNPANLQLQNFSIEAWIKRASTTSVSPSGADGELICYGSGGYGLGFHNNGQLFLTKVDVDEVDVGTTITDTNFHHVAVTKTGTNIVFYIDGVPSTRSFSPSFSFTTQLAIGARGDSLGNVFLGTIDEVSIYNRGLTGAEVQAIYTAGSAGKCASQVAPYIVTQPAGRTVTVGGSTAFTIVAAGTLPLSYQWSFNGTNIDGATTTILSLDGVQFDQAGNYAVAVSNSISTVLSSNALLTVVPAPVCTPVPSGLVSWWKGEGDTVDQVGGNNGTAVGDTSYLPSEVGQGFFFNASGSAVDVGNPPNLQLQDMTIEAWIKRSNSSLVTADPYLSANIFACAWGGYALGIWTDGRIFLSKVGYSGVFSTGTITDINQFHHVVAAKSGTNVTLYIDGVAESVGPYDPGFVFNGPSAIGARGLDYANSFLGQIDEVSIYNRGLSTAEVLAIYNAGSAGKCVPLVAPYIITQPASQTVSAGANTSFSVVAGGTLPMSYQWSFNGTNIDGATTTILSLVGVQFDQAGDYAVAVSNSISSVLSSNALLTVVPAPVCTPVPSGLVSWWKGESNTVDQLGGNYGTVKGNTSYGAAEVGQGFVFNGSGAAVDVGNPTNLQLQDLTIEGWIKRSNSSLVTADPYLSANIFACAWGGYALGIWTDGRIFLSKVGYSGVFSTNTITDINQFHHVVAAKSGTNVTLYIDGVTESVGPYDPGFVFNGPSAIGARGLDYANSFLGTIDEVSIYNRGLDTGEVMAIYNAGSAGKCLGGGPAVAGNLRTATVQNRPIVLSIAKMLSSASNPDNASLNLSTVSSASTNGGAVGIFTNSVIYIPMQNFAGMDQFHYTISDGRGGSSSASVTIQVQTQMVASRNMLSVTPVSGGHLVKFAGIPGHTYTVQRAPAVSGPWTSLANILMGSSGIGLFTDNNPPANGAYYRVAYQ